MKNLNIGCGLNKISSSKDNTWINIDISPVCNPDMVVDIEDGLPFDINSFKEVIAHDVLEQISTPRKFIFVMNELWKVIEPNGRLMIRVPNAAKIASFQDPMDIRHFTEDTFTYMQQTNPHYQNYGKIYGFKPWKVERISCKNENLMEFMLMPIK